MQQLQPQEEPFNRSHPFLGVQAREEVRCTGESGGKQMQYGLSDARVLLLGMAPKSIQQLATLLDHTGKGSWLCLRLALLFCCSALVAARYVAAHIRPPRPPWGTGP